MNFVEPLIVHPEAASLPVLHCSVTVLHYSNTSKYNIFCNDKSRHLSLCTDFNIDLKYLHIIWIGFHELSDLADMIRYVSILIDANMVMQNW